MQKIIWLSLLSLFSIFQMSACFYAAFKAEGLLGLFFFIIGGITCLFGGILDFILLMMALDIFTSIFSGMAANLGKKTEEETE